MISEACPTNPREASGLDPEAVHEEQDGDLTQRDPDPKADRIEQLAEKLDGLADEASGETVDHIEAARDHCIAYLAEGGDGVADDR
ncbi:DUF7553 family protein [Halopiger goleimassiliensis]|uniref:DUF7553 family protein n=1 Tax=Halopiger goleimassiliensis TaxID=1293048 RepID=UPI000677F467|nr:hypothetical protein [Halopiger goleimassiliensis]